jgi:NDP-sugar pyrophosphorylase family protein
MFPQVVIEAGGLGTRLGAAYSNIPKILAPVNGKPFLVLQLEKLIDEGVEHVHYLLGYKNELITDLLKNSNFPIDITYTIEPPDLLGTGGALLNAIDELDEEFFLTYGDSFLLADFNSINWQIVKSGLSNSMCVTEAVDQENALNVYCSDDRVRRYSKDPKDSGNNALDYGLLKLQKSSILRFTPSVRKFDLADLFNFLIDGNELYSLLVTDKYFDIGSPTRLRKLEEFLNENPR